MSIRSEWNLIDNLETNLSYVSFCNNDNDNDNDNKNKVLNPAYKPESQRVYNHTKSPWVKLTLKEEMP